MEAEIPLICGLFVILSVIIVAMVVHHRRKTSFNPTFIRSDSGNLKMEFYGFGGEQAERYRRFYRRYRVGLVITFMDRRYVITDLKEAFDSRNFRPDIKIVAHLREI